MPNGSVIRPWRYLNWPNRISLLRLLLLPPFLVLLMNQNQSEWGWARHAAFGIFLVMAVSDALDGFLARRLHARTRLGSILDPLADKAMIISAAALLSLPQSAVPGAQLHNWVVVAIVGKDLWVMVGFVVVYLVTDRFRVQPTLSGKACTFGQAIMLAAVLVAPDLNRLGATVGSWAAETAMWAVLLLSIAGVVSYTRLGLRFIAEAEKPLEAGDSRSRQNHDGSH
jgi:cardiolipin synthase